MERQFSKLLQDLKEKKEDPYLYALQERDLPFLEWLSESKVAMPNLTAVLEHLVGQYGDIELEYLDWFDSHYPKYRKRFYGELWHEAVGLRNKELIKWLQDKDYEPEELDEMVLESLKGKDFKILKFLSEMGYISDIFDPKTGEPTDKTKLRIAYLNPKFEYPRYTQTRRPVTKMPFTGNHCVKDAKYLPVVRYEELYFGQHMSIKEEVCGTFYFYEPDSENYLNLGRVLIAANKVDAAIKLQININSSIQLFLEYKFTLKEWSKMLDKFDLPEAQEIQDYLTTLISKESDIDLNTLSILDLYLPQPGNLVNKVNAVYEIIKRDKKEYMGYKLVSHFDYLDQKICKAAQKEGYDTILLQREPGEQRANTEILDVRTRKQSYDNICKEKFNIQTHSSNYPSIWFPEYGFMSY